MTTDRQFSLGFPRPPVARGSLRFLIVTVIICWQLFIIVSKFIEFSWKFFFSFSAVMTTVKLSEGWKHVRNYATVRQWALDMTSFLMVRLWGDSYKNPPCASIRILFKTYSHKFQLQFTRAACLTFGFHATQWNQTQSREIPLQIDSDIFIPLIKG